MQLDDLLNKESEWLKGTGFNSDIVISSRIRLARNLKKLPFSHWAGKDQLSEILNIICEAIDKADYMKGSLFVKMRDTSELDRQFLVERHLISWEHTKDPMYKGVFVSKREVISIMINEEDHLRTQTLQSGFNLKDAWYIINEIDDALSRHLDFAFSPTLGYLTACPTNTGTGMRASVMLHLPALVMSKQIGRILHTVGKLSHTVRGLYGEGTEASGNLFQLSNQGALGRMESEIIDNLERIVKQVIEYEKKARESLFNQNKGIIEDRIWRAYGILKTARRISSEETINLLSLVRLGVDLGILGDLDRKKINELFILIQPAHLQKIESKVLKEEERDLSRAELIRARLYRGRA